MEDAPTLIVRLPNPVGDVVMTTPLLAALRKELGETRLVAAGKPAHGPLLDGQTELDAFLPLPAGVAAQAKALRGERAQTILLLPNSWSSALAARLARIPRRIGRRAHGRGALLTTRLPAVGPARPMTRIYLDLLAALGLPVPRFGAEPPARLHATPADPARPWFGVAPGAAFGPSKQYPLEQLRSAVSQVAARSGLRPLLIGGPEEAELLVTCARAFAADGLDPELPPSGDLADAKARIASCRVFLTMDSGARHIAAALGVPQVVLYGPTHPGWSAHALGGTTILRRDELDCIACHEKICPIDHRCMTQIPADAVADAVLKRLGPEPLGADPSPAGPPGVNEKREPS